MILALIACGFFLAYANGANDNFKGVATLYGSGIASYKQAILFSTLMTFAGSITALYLAKGLIAAFSGKGLVPATVTTLPSFALAVALSSALTVMLATYFSFPISTTHALTGALVGVGLMASNEGVAFTKLGTIFFLPLLLSPFLSLALSYFSTPILSRFSKKEACLCEITPVTNSTFLTTNSSLIVGSTEECKIQEATPIILLKSENIFTKMHFLSAGFVCFARGLNDTPKLAALFLLVPFLNTNSIVFLVATAMAIGGLIHSKKIAETMSHKLTPMNNIQGFSANLVTALVVTGGSNLHLPVSTTHVSCGTLFGLGLSQKTANFLMIKQILLAWVTTLPVAAILGIIIFKTISGLN